MRSRILTGAVAAALALGVLAPATAADAASAKKYTSCAKVHRDYTGGIAKPGVTRNTLSDGSKVALGGRVKHSRSLYDANYRRLDRDRDGIACEILP